MREVSVLETRINFRVMDEVMVRFEFRLAGTKEMIVRCAVIN
jgi:hypothetical protein